MKNYVGVKVWCYDKERIMVEYRAYDNIMQWTQPRYLTITDGKFLTVRDKKYGIGSIKAFKTWKWAKKCLRQYIQRQRSCIPSKIWK